MSVLPGQIRKLRITSHLNLTCDHSDPDTNDYCPRKASHEVIGEVDSFGHECRNYCEEHIEEVRKALAEEDTSGICDWCQNHANKLKPTRDIDEGTLGPLYDVCITCIREQNERIDEELDDADEYHGRSTHSPYWADA